MAAVPSMLGPIAPPAGHDEEDGTIDLHDTEASTCTNLLLTHPPGIETAIKKSAYSLPAASITFKDLSFSLPPARRGGERRPVLEPCSGHFEAGSLVAIMGPSGCGKTTLLDMLAAKKTSAYSGEVLINGLPRDRLFRRIAAYVGQEEMMPPHWTVREAIRFNATLKRQPGRAHQGVEGWIDMLLATFDLGSVADTMIGSAEVRGISGGQRRRVTLARGVAAQASLLFCDEPTSGLSATDAETCVKALRVVAKRFGVTCLVVIHQPRHEVALLFDTLVLLTSNPGRMAYSGPMAEAKSYWEARGHPVPLNVNPTDFFMDLLTPETPLDRSTELVAAFKEVRKPSLDAWVESKMTERGQSVMEMLSEGGQRASGGPYAVPFCTQLKVVLGRKLRLTLRNPMALGLPLFIPILQGLVVGYMFQGIGESPDLLRQIMFVFCMVTMLCLAGTMSLIVLITERTLMKFESSEALYSEGASSLASCIIDVPLALLGALFNILIMAAMARLEWSLFKTVLAWALLLFFVYDSLFAFIGAVAADTRQAQVLATPFISVFMLFNGFIVSKADSPEALHWIFDISPNAYAMQSIVVMMAKNFGFQGQLLLEKFGYEEAEDHKGLAVLFSMIILFRIGQQLGLKYLNNIRR